MAHTPKKTCREMHKIIRTRKATIQGKRKGEKKWKKKKDKRKIVQQQLYIIIRRGSHNQGRKKQIQMN